MSVEKVDSEPWTIIDSQPSDIRLLPVQKCDALIISAISVDGQWVILSRYGDDCWQLTALPTNRSPSSTYIDFHRMPTIFRATMKAIIYRYLSRGRIGQQRAKGPTIFTFFEQAIPFFRYLDSLNIDSFSDVGPVIINNYINHCRDVRTNSGKPLKRRTLALRFQCIETLYELSQYTNDPIPKHPWPDTSASQLAGVLGRSSRHRQEGTTPLIPDEMLCLLFDQAYGKVQQGKALLDLRDAIAEASSTWKIANKNTHRKKSSYLSELGWKGGLKTLKKALNDLRTACYIILACTSGCRNHELANLASGSHLRTQDDDGTLYHWFRSKSEKTDTGMHDWMIPEIAVRAIRLMERWAKPYQDMIAKEILTRRRKNPLDPEIARARQHQHALFLGLRKGNLARTLSRCSCNNNLNAFAKEAGLNWPFATHQFRRTFANYVAHSRFGDLRYLREHFAHWSMDMTLSYAMDERWGHHFDLDLYQDIQSEYDSIKISTVDGWIKDDFLAGGYGQSLKKWQRDPSNLAIFKDHNTMVASIAESTAIRSNGHAWCTADSDGCIGNTLERTRCGDCGNAVIGLNHFNIYRQLHNNLKELLECRDIGESGRVRVLRDLDRSSRVLSHLGYKTDTEA